MNNYLWLIFCIYLSYYGIANTAEVTIGSFTKSLHTKKTGEWLKLYNKWYQDGRSVEDIFENLIKITVLSKFACTCEEAKTTEKVAGNAFLVFFTRDLKKQIVDNKVQDRELFINHIFGVISEKFNFSQKKIKKAKANLLWKTHPKHIKNGRGAQKGATEGSLPP